MPDNLLLILIGVLVLLVALSGIRFIPNNRIGIVEKRFGRRSLKSGFIALNADAGFKSDETMRVMSLNHVEEMIAPIVYTVPLQLLSYHVALIKGTDVDQPRNLAKSVTVE